MIRSTQKAVHDGDISFDRKILAQQEEEKLERAVWQELVKLRETGYSKISGEFRTFLNQRRMISLKPLI